MLIITEIRPTHHTTRVKTLIVCKCHKHSKCELVLFHRHKGDGYKLRRVHTHLSLCPFDNSNTVWTLLGFEFLITFRCLIRIVTGILMKPNWGKQCRNLVSRCLLKISVLWWKRLDAKSVAVSTTKVIQHLKLAVNYCICLINLS